MFLHNRNSRDQGRSSIANLNVPEYRFEKEFDAVQDVFELQVCFIWLLCTADARAGYLLICRLYRIAKP